MAANGFETQRSFVLLNRDLLFYIVLIFPFSGLFLGGAAEASNAGSAVSQVFLVSVFALSASCCAPQGQLAGLAVGSGLAFTSHDLDHGLLLLVSISRSYDSSSGKRGDRISQHRTRNIDLFTSNGTTADPILSVLDGLVR